MKALWHFKERSLVEELLQQSDERFQREIQQFITASDPGLLRVIDTAPLQYGCG